jgi:hypothetical protein
MLVLKEDEEVAHAQESQQKEARDWRQGSYIQLLGRPWLDVVVACKSATGSSKSRKLLAKVVVKDGDL